MKKRLLTGLLVVIIIVSMMPGSLMEKTGVKKDVDAAVTLQDPRIKVDSSMNAGQRVTYDCVWFGSYPQTEIVDQASTSGVYGKPWSLSSDYEENSSLYNTLKNANGWDSNGDVIISGAKYRRIKSGDASFLSEDSDDYYYYWNSMDEYHYFRYEPIKWRVLDVDSSGAQALLLADKVLDVKEYNTKDENVTWKTSTIRSWLNGYGSSANAVGTDYTSKNFINLAFTSLERSVIESAYLDNKTTGRNTENYGGDNTSDKVFLLSHYDMYYSNVSASYGFYKADDVNFDEARRRKGSTYAKAMGIWINASSKYLGNCLWWLRSPGSVASYAAYIHDSGSVNLFGYDAYDNGTGVCPALKLNLLSADLYSYAGTVCTDGTVHEEGWEDVTPATYTITYNANGGTGAPQNQLKTMGEDLILSTTEPVRNGYTFMGWGTSSSSTTISYNKGGTYSTDSNITLYAVWVKKSGEEEGSGNDDPITPAPQPITKKVQTITAYSKTVPINNGAFSIGAKTSGNGKLTYKSSNIKAATISSVGRVTLKGYGITTIFITAAETSTYKQATKVVTIMVVPKRMKLKSVKSPGKGQLQAKWVKDKAASGYQIQFCRNMSFKKGAFQKNISKKLTSLKRPVTGLDSKKKYYVRIRAYKKVNGKNILGIWSYGRVIKIK